MFLSFFIVFTKYCRNSTLFSTVKTILNYLLLFFLIVSTIIINNDMVYTQGFLMTRYMGVRYIGSSMSCHWIYTLRHITVSNLKQASNELHIISGRSLTQVSKVRLFFKSWHFSAHVSTAGQTFVRVSCLKGHRLYKTCVI